MNKFYDEIQAQLRASLFGRLIAAIGVPLKLRDISRGICRRDTIWDKLLFRRFQDWLGGEIRVGCVGAAAADGDILNYLRATLGVYVRREPHFIDWLIDVSVGWLIDWLIDLSVGWLIEWLTDSLDLWWIDWLIDLLDPWLIDSFDLWLIDWLIDYIITWSYLNVSSTFSV